MDDDQMMPLRSYEDSGSPLLSVEPVNEHARAAVGPVWLGTFLGTVRACAQNCAHNTLICEKMEVVSHLRFAGEGGGLKIRCTFEGQTWIRQVLISRTLSVCGEVAERLKAAVC